MSDKNIIVKRVKKNHAAHHGGVWKIAYADFVTALMAFFLLMWLLETMTNYELKGIADYFNTPLVDAMKKGISNKKNKVSEPKGDTKQDESDPSVDLESAKKELKRLENKQLEELKERIEEQIDSNALLKEFKNQLLIDITTEGLRIQVLDEQNRAMFEMGSAELMPYTKAILREIGSALNGVPNRLGISGHTDANQFARGMGAYSNWELSTERANAARRELIQGGMSSDKVLHVVGLAEAVPFDKANPLNPINRRISIVVMNAKTEQAIVNKESSGQPSAQEPKPDGSSGHTPPAPEAAHDTKEPNTDGAETHGHAASPPEESKPDEPPKSTGHGAE